MKSGEDGSGVSFGAPLDTIDTATEEVLARELGKSSLNRLLVGSFSLVLFLFLLLLLLLWFG